MGLADTVIVGVDVGIAVVGRKVGKAVVGFTVGFAVDGRAAVVGFTVGLAVDGAAVVGFNVELADGAIVGLTDGVKNITPQFALAAL